MKEITAVVTPPLAQLVRHLQKMPCEKKGIRRSVTRVSNENCLHYLVVEFKRSINTHSMSRLINLALLLSFLVCYLEWGKDQSAFIFQVEYSLLSGGKDFQTFIHPLIFLPFIGQLMLLYSLFRNEANNRITLIGWALLSLLVAIILIVGLLSLDLKIIGSTMPFILVSIWFFVARRKLAAGRDLKGE